VVKARNKLYSSGGAWTSGSMTRGFYDGKYMQPESVYDLFDVVGTFAIEMDNALWADFNVEPAIDRAFWAVKSSASEVVVKAISAAKGTWKALDLAMKVVKWGAVAALAYGGYVLVQKVRGRR
jgi:hypothetical protein